MTASAARALVLGATMALAATAAAAGGATPPLVEGARYVAMGSSFASGAGIAPFASGTPARCQRSTDNYAAQLSRTRKLGLVDVTCSGATTAHILGPWGELPPQIDAVTADTALVTITIGGNDVGYIGSLMMGSCGTPPAAGEAPRKICQMIAPSGRAPTPMPIPTEEKWEKLEAALTRIIAEIHRRAPRARIVFVDYLTVLPPGALCAQAPLSSQAARDGRAIAARLARLTADVARRNRAEVLPASKLSIDAHSACAATPWMAGFIPADGQTAFAPYHPNRAGMTAIATALDRLLRD